MSDKAKRILDGLKDAIAGNLAAVTIDGERWVKVQPTTYAKEPETITARLRYTHYRQATEDERERDPLTDMYEERRMMMLDEDHRLTVLDEEGKVLWSEGSLGDVRKRLDALEARLNYKLDKALSRQANP